MRSAPRIAFIVDALPAIGGGEKTLFSALEVFPCADIFSLVYNKGIFKSTPVAGRTVRTSFLDNFPLAGSHHRWLLPLMPSAIERFDLSEYDLVVSFSYAVAHGVRVQEGTQHVSYTYTPMRYAWSELNVDGRRAPRNPALELLLKRFRAWDRAAAARVDKFAVISKGIARRVLSAYGRSAEIIYPPVEVERFRANRRRESYFVTLSRLVPHKRLDLVVEAFSRLKLPLKIIGTGPEGKRLHEHAASNIEFLGFQSDETVAQLLSRARGLVCAGEEDFGIALVEAQAAGCPVIAYQLGGALETVIENVTGIFFMEQTAASLISAVERFESISHSFRIEDLIASAHRFAKPRFKRTFHEFVG